MDEFSLKITLAGRAHATNTWQSRAVVLNVWLLATHKTEKYIIWRPICCYHRTILQVLVTQNSEPATHLLRNTVNKVSRELFLLFLTLFFMLSELNSCFRARLGLKRHFLYIFSKIKCHISEKGKKVSRIIWMAPYMIMLSSSDNVPSFTNRVTAETFKICSFCDVFLPLKHIYHNCYSIKHFY